MKTIGNSKETAKRMNDSVEVLAKSIYGSMTKDQSLWEELPSEHKKRYRQWAVMEILGQQVNKKVRV